MAGASHITYLKVFENVDTIEPVEVPIEANGELLLSSVNGQFPGTVGLRFRSDTGAWRGLRSSKGIIFPPPEGWVDIDYYIVLESGFQEQMSGGGASGSTKKPSGETKSPLKKAPEKTIAPPAPPTPLMSKDIKCPPGKAPVEVKRGPPMSRGLVSRDIMTEAQKKASGPRSKFERDIVKKEDDVLANALQLAKNALKQLEETDTLRKQSSEAKAAVKKEPGDSKNATKKASADPKGPLKMALANSRGLLKMTSGNSNGVRKRTKTDTPSSKPASSKGDAPVSTQASGDKSGTAPKVQKVEENSKKTPEQITPQELTQRIQKQQQQHQQQLQQKLQQQQEAVKTSAQNPLASVPVHQLNPLNSAMFPVNYLPMLPVQFPQLLPQVLPPAQNTIPTLTGNRNLQQRGRQQIQQVQPLFNIPQNSMAPTILNPIPANLLPASMPQQQLPGTNITINTSTNSNNNTTIKVTAKGPSADEGTMFHGLTLYLPLLSMSRSKVDDCPLMTMFESCTRSNKFLKISSTLTPDDKEWLSLLHIDQMFICSGRAKRLRLSKVDAATQALTMLRKCQPIQYKPRAEMCLKSDETIPGFTLNLVSSSLDSATCLKSITESCVQCNLNLTLWHDKGEVFGATHACVLLINMKPICLATGRNLEEAKMAAAKQAVSILKVNHPVVYKTHRHKDLLAQVSRQDRSSSDSTKSKEKQPRADSKSKETDNDPQAIASIVCQNLPQGSKNANSKFVTETVVPGLTIYLPKDGHDRDAFATLHRSASCSDLRLRFNNIGTVERDGKPMVASALLIGDCVVAWGFGDTASSSKADISYRTALDTLMKTAPTKYYDGRNALKRMALEAKKKKMKYSDSRDSDRKSRRTDDDDKSEDEEFDVSKVKQEKLFSVLSQWTGSEPGDAEAMKDCDDVIQMHIEELLTLSAGDAP